MSILASDLIKHALELIGAYQPSDSLQAADAASCLVRLNSMLSSWNTERLACYVDVTLNKTYVPNQGSYSVGPGGDLNGQRPDALNWAWVRMNTTGYPQDVPQFLLNEEQWDLYVAQKTVPGTYPSAVWYEPTYPLGTLHVWPVPQDTSYQQFIRYKQFLSSGLTLTGTVDLPEGYQEAIETNLALRIAPLFGKTAVQVAQSMMDPSTGESIAKIALGNIKRVNQVLMTRSLRSDVPQGNGGGPAFNILTNGPNPPFQGR